jgi:hypothetical protein
MREEGAIKERKKKKVKGREEYVELDVGIKRTGQIE